jgi:YVTN family beta-propeller protein
MTFRISRLLALASFACGCLVVGPARAQNAYIANVDSDTVSVIDTATSKVTATITVGSGPFGVAVTRDGSKVYVASCSSLCRINNGTLSVIDTASNTLIGSPITVGITPTGVAVSPDGSTVYVTNQGPSINNGTVSVINTATNNVTKTITDPSFSGPFGVAVSPDGSTVYLANVDSDTVSVIDTATSKVTTTITVGFNPSGVAVSPDGRTVYAAVESFAVNQGNGVSVIDVASKTVTTTIALSRTCKCNSGPGGVAVSPDGSKVYATYGGNNTVSVIDAASNKETATIPVGSFPLGVAVTPDGSRVYVANNDLDGPLGTVSVIDTTNNNAVTTINSTGFHSPSSFGVFIQPAPQFAGKPGQANCIGGSLSALVKKYGGLAHAAAALDYPSVPDLQNAVAAYCGG